MPGYYLEIFNFIKIKLMESCQRITPRFEVISSVTLVTGVISPETPDFQIGPFRGQNFGTPF